MLRKLAKTESEVRSALALIESDRQYFEMGALVEKLSVGRLTWMPGLTDLAASCVVHRIDCDLLSVASDTWIEDVENSLRARSVRRARVYLDTCPPGIDALFCGHGYDHRVEIGFLAPIGHPKPPTNVRLCEVLTGDEWNLKQCLHEEAMEGPDGYRNQAALWVRMERQKCATGDMRCFLVRHDKEIVATVGTIVNEGLVRLKNIVVSPHQRRRGFGVAIVQLLWQMAETQHDCRLGVFGVEGGTGRRLYQRAGLYEITTQHEWSRLITVNND